MDNYLISFFYNNLTTVAIIIFLFLFAILVITKPNIAFDKNKIPRTFGLGYKNKTILPVWLIVIIFAIIAYLITIYLANFNKFIF